MTDWRSRLDATIDTGAESLRRIRRHLHAHPEPSREEYETTRFLARQLEEAGIPFRLIPSGRGIVAGPEFGSEPRAYDHGPPVAIRADIDALQIQDAKTVPYRSTRPGVMHACGHDAHTTMALGAARALWDCREALPWPTPWRLLLQPAEEVGEGAREMVAAGAVDGARAVIALHVDLTLAVGRIAQRQGPLTAFCDGLSVVVRGRGGHAARPHQAVDPIAAAVQFVGTLYQLIPRSVDAREPVVLSFGSIHGGTSPNVIPESVTLLGTVRTLSAAAAAHIKAQIRQVGHALAAATGTSIEITFDSGVAGVINDPAVTETCMRAAEEVVGREHVDTIDLPSMGAEDFAAYLAHVPGCMLRIGVASPEVGAHHLHEPTFDIDERALALGAKFLAHSAVLLNQPRG